MLPIAQPSSCPRALARPYDPVVDPMLVRWAAQQNIGTSTLAKRIGVPLDLFRRWILDYPEFAAAVREGERTADARVVQALFKRALGYEYDNLEVLRKRMEEIAKRRRIHLAPDVRAATFWLKNRQPQNWRENPPPPVPEDTVVRIRPMPDMPVVCATVDDRSKLPE